MFRTIGIILITLLAFQFLALTARAQSRSNLKVYESEKYSVKYRADWLVTKEEEILNIYPKENFGAVTISVHQGITFPMEETKSMIIDLNKSPDSSENVRMETIGASTVFTYEYLDKIGKVRWFTKVIRKESELFLMTINIQETKWKGTKAMFFEVVDSFKLKP